MEQGWERRTRLPPLEREALEHALRRAGWQRPLESVSVLGGGLVNLNAALQVGAPRELVVLRLYLRDADACAKEEALLKHVARDVPAPAPLARGTLALQIDGAVAERPWLLLTHVAGRRLADLLPALDEPALSRAGAGIGAALARLHALRSADLGFLDASLAVPAPMGGLRDVWSGYLRELLFAGRAGPKLGSARRDRLAAYVTDQVEALAPLEGTYALLHADCKPTNVLVLDDGSLSGLLDWEFAWSGPPLFDLGQMLRWPLPAAYEEALIEDYARGGGTLPPGWRHMAQLLDLMNLVGFLDQEAARPQQTRDVLALLEEVSPRPR